MVPQSVSPRAISASVTLALSEGQNTCKRHRELARHLWAPSQPVSVLAKTDGKDKWFLANVCCCFARHCSQSLWLWCCLARVPCQSVLPTSLWLLGAASQPVSHRRHHRGSVLQCVAVCCSAMWRVAVRCHIYRALLWVSLRIYRALVCFCHLSQCNGRRRL